MATRLAWFWMIGLLLTAGCQSSGGRTPVSMVPAAVPNDTPRPKAEAAPRGTPSGMLSTAAGQNKKPSGEEESAIEVPVAQPPKETIAAPPSIELPPAPVGPVAPMPPPTFAPAAIEAPKSPIPAPPPAAPKPTPPASPISSAPKPVEPSLAPPVPVEAKSPPLEAVPVSTKLPTAPSSLTPKIGSPTANSSELAAPLRSLYEKASHRCDQMDSYTMRMRRREVVGSTSRPEELILAKFRREPFSIYLKWVGEEGKHREVCYVLGQHEGLVHTLMAPGDLFLFAGKHFKVAPDSALVKSNCRYPITEGGLGPLVARFGRLVTAIEKGDPSEGTARYLGKVKRPEFEDAVDGVVQTLPAKYEGLFPGGGQRYWYFDQVNGLPTLIVTYDDRGKEVEYYCHDRIQAPVNLDDDDFNPQKLWKTASK